MPLFSLSTGSEVLGEDLLSKLGTCMAWTVKPSRYARLVIRREGTEAAVGNLSEMGFGVVISARRLARGVHLGGRHCMGPLPARSAPGLTLLFPRGQDLGYGPDLITYQQMGESTR